MTIDTIYINEAIRIRKEYLTNLQNINNSEGMIKEIIEHMNNIKDDIANVNDLNEEEYIDKLKELDIILDRIKTNILPYHENIMELGKDQQKLFLLIKDKYKDLTAEEIQQQIAPHIIKFDEKMKKMI